MKKPNLATFFFGNPVIGILILIVGGFLIYGWWIDQVPVLIAVAALSAILNSAAAHDRLTKYQQWKRAWDHLGGESRPDRGKPLRQLIGLLIWVGMALAATTLDRQQPVNLIAIALFVAGSFAMFAVAIRRSWRRTGSAGRSRNRRAPKDVPVEIALPVPRSSPDTRQLYKGLPDYCARLN
jgi:hypothetical protein